MLNLRRLLVLQLLLALVLAPLARAETPAPTAKPDPLAIKIVRAPTPGTTSAAAMASRLQLRAPGLDRTAFRRSESGLYLPDRDLVVIDRKSGTEQARWRAQRILVGRYLRQSGVRLSPLPYQKLVENIRKRAEAVLARKGVSLADWKLVAVQGASANVVNAAAWGGGIITINRPLIDLAYQLAAVASSVESKVELDRALRALVAFRKGQGPAPEALSRALQPRQRQLAESIVAGVVLHEMGHAVNGDTALKERKLWTPGSSEPRDNAAQRDKERKADAFAILLGAAGRVAPAATAIPLLDYYWFIERPNFVEKGRYDVIDWRSHPLDFERFNNMRKQLGQLGANLEALPDALDPRGLVGRDGRPLTKTVADPVRPPQLLGPLGYPLAPSVKPATPPQPTAP
jgi:hypothetical protein